jgi:aminomethyltransferase
MSELKRTPLHDYYAGMPGVKLVDFGGWDMPVQFQDGILAEHKAVREAAGVFDVSHMGEVSIKGPDAGAFLDSLVTNRIAGAVTGRCLYTPMCRDNGGCIDDLLVYVLGDEDYLLVVNAANTEKDFAWISRKLADSNFRARAVDVSSQWALLALQGPESESILTGLADNFIPGDLEYYHHAGVVKVAGFDALVSRTGYTGEDGFELYCRPEDAVGLWQSMENAGAAPCGLGARDVLRLEARLPLYGHELRDDITPLEAGLGMFVKFDKEDFVGRNALAAQKEEGIPRRLYGLEMIDAGVPREGYSVYAADRLGFVTSGGPSPVRDGFIALALLKRGAVSVDDEVDVEIRGKKKRAKVVKTPFYPPGTMRVYDVTKIIMKENL